MPEREATGVPGSPTPARSWWENHLPDCGTTYRGCSPACPKAQVEAAISAAVAEEQERMATLMQEQQDGFNAIEVKAREDAYRGGAAEEREAIRLLAWKLPMPPQASDVQDQRKIALFVCDLDAAIRARGRC